MNKIAIIYFLFIINCVNSQPAWTPLNTGTTGNITTLNFINANTGFSISVNTSIPETNIIKTTNGGANWNVKFSQNINFGKFQLYNNFGFIQTSAGFLKTTNMGESWLQKNIPYNIKTIYFYNESNGYGITDSLTCYKSSDAGETWQIVRTGSFSLRIITASFINSNTGFAVTGGGYGAGEYIYKTTNGCANWSAGVFTGTFSMTSSLKGEFSKFSSDTIYLSGPDSLKKTVNGGLSWQFAGFINNVTSVYPGYMFFNNSKTGYATCMNVPPQTPLGILWKTSNAGINWIQCPYFPAVPLNCIYFVNELTGYIGGYYGAIYKTTNGGLTFVNANSSIAPGKFTLSQNYPNPFNPLTRINYELPITNYVSLKVYDNLGNEVETLVNEKQNAGSYSVDFNAWKYPSGIYFYKLVTEKFIETKKMVLIK